MDPRRIVIFGNASSGKSTLAHRLAAALDVEVLELDHLRWVHRPDQPRAAADRIQLVRTFTEGRDSWIVEEIHASLLAVALESANELHFLNPGFDVCRQRARARPWDPRKASSPEEQAALIAQTEPWFRAYDTRNDETSLSAHRALFEAFDGTKTEHTGPSADVSSST